MLSPSVPQYRRRRGRSKPAAPSGLTITAVTISVGSQLVVHFSAPIVWNGIDVPSEFKAFTQDGFFDSPTAVVGAGADWIELDFNAGCDPGAAWELNGAMAGITPEVAFPQAGTVQA